MSKHYYRFSYRSSTGGDDEQMQALAAMVGDVVIDVIIETDQPLDDGRPVRDYLATLPGHIRFSSWEEFSPETVQANLSNLRRRAIHFDPTLVPHPATKN